MEMVLTWLKSHWRWSGLNLFAVSAFFTVLTQGSTDWDADTFDPMLESGKWAIRFLLASLTMTPLNAYFGWSSAIKLRKSAGLWAFGFASLHILLYVREVDLYWLIVYMPSFLAFGLTGIVILTALAVTSNRWSMQRLGKNWKRLHRLVYLAGIAVVTHSLLAMTVSKKMTIRDPQAQNELKLYAAMLAALLVVRIPLVRQLLVQIPLLPKRPRKLDRQIGPVDMPDGAADLWPKIHGRESGVSLKPTFIIPNEMPKPYEWSSSSGTLRQLKRLSASYVDSPSEEEAEVQ